MGTGRLGGPVEGGIFVARGCRLVGQCQEELLQGFASVAVGFGRRSQLGPALGSQGLQAEVGSWDSV